MLKRQIHLVNERAVYADRVCCWWSVGGTWDASKTPAIIAVSSSLRRKWNSCHLAWSNNSGRPELYNHLRGTSTVASGHRGVWFVLHCSKPPHRQAASVRCLSTMTETREGVKCEVGARLKQTVLSAVSLQAFSVKVMSRRWIEEVYGVLWVAEPLSSGDMELAGTDIPSDGAHWIRLNNNGNNSDSNNTWLE